MAGNEAREHHASRLAEQNWRSEATPPHGHEPAWERYEACEQKGADPKNRDYSAGLHCKPSYLYVTAI